jgi:hypothetical protein
MSDESNALLPSAERTVNFYGDQISVALVGAEEAYVPLRTISEFLGLAWGSQRNRLLRDEVLSERAHTVKMRGADGRQRDMLCLPLDLLPGWLFGINSSRVKPELASKMKRYREECFRVLWREFQAERQGAQTPAVSRTTLAHVREMGLAIVQLAEQQMALEGQVEEMDVRLGHVAGQQMVVRGEVEVVSSRLDRAAEVVGDLQRRLGAVERRVESEPHINDTQAAEISGSVKALAQLLAERDASKNHYQGIFAELYRRFGVSSYKLVRRDHYEAVLAFLDEWRIKGTT